MRNLIRADLRRVFLKPTFYILVFLVVLDIIISKNAESAVDQMDNLRNIMRMAGLFIITIASYLALYGDEFKSGVMINVIGSGMSRKKIVVAKLIDASLIMLIFYVLLYLVALAKNMTAGIAVTPKQNLFLLLYCFFCLIKGIGFLTLASFVAFATWSTPGGMIILIFATALSNLFFKGLQSHFAIPIYDLSFEGLLDTSYASFAAGGLGWQLIPAMVIYIGGLVVLTIILFNRREVDL